MSRKGNCCHGVLVGSWFVSFNNERLYEVGYSTYDNLKAVSFDCIEVCYNWKRQHSTLVYNSLYS